MQSFFTGTDFEDEKSENSSVVVDGIVRDLLQNILQSLGTGILIFLYK